MTDPVVDKIKDKEIEEQEKEVISKFKLTLTHRHFKGLERCIQDIQRKIETLTKENNANIKASGPARLPTKFMHITTRKSPCGNGTNTFDHFEMRIHKRVIRIACSDKNFQAIVGGIFTEPGMLLDAIKEE